MVETALSTSQLTNGVDKYLDRSPHRGCHESLRLRRIHQLAPGRTEMTECNRWREREREMSKQHTVRAGRSGGAEQTKRVALKRGIQVHKVSVGRKLRIRCYFCARCSSRRRTSADAAKAALGVASV